jgi:hypothetical protein
MFRGKKIVQTLKEPEQPSEPLDPQRYIDQTFNNRKKKTEQPETDSNKDERND